jgi:hypothetical protein
MSDSRGSRFAFEILFLVALAVAAALTDLQPLEIAGVMLVGWLVVALLEWASWRERPHFGSGLPPRYYVPQVNLPPAQPLEQVAAGYPETRDEAPTWIASAALRNEMLGDWPVAVAVDHEPEPKPEPEPVHEADPWTYPEELPVAPLGELAPPQEAEPAPQIEPEPQVAPVAVAVEPEPELEPEPEPEPEPAPAALEPEPVVEAAPELVLVHAEVRMARWSIDPLADPEPRRRFRRRAADPATVEVPARPEGTRALPGRMARQD